MRTFILFPIVVFGIIGNCLLLHVIYANRSLRSPTNFLIFNMAVSDLITLVLCPGLFVFKEIFQTYKLGEIGCKAEGSLEAALLITSVITLCFISYDRLTAIAFPMTTRLNYKTVKKAIAVTWIGGFVIASPLAIFRDLEERQWRNFLESFCFENLDVLPIYWHCLVIALVWMPMTVLIFCYSMIFWKLDRYEKLRKKRDNPMQTSYKRKFAVTLFIVVVSFGVLRLPFTTVVFIHYNMSQKSEMNQITGSFKVLWYVSRYLLFLDSALTPVIYGITNENFRRAFRHTWFYKMCCFCKYSDAQPRTVEIFTFASRNDQLQPRNAIVTNRNLLTPNWLPERLSRFSAGRNQKKTASSEGHA